MRLSLKKAAHKVAGKLLLRWSNISVVVQLIGGLIGRLSGTTL